MGGYDPGVDKLQVFCSVLEAANHLLETATPDLEARGKALIEAEPDLREELTGLGTEVHGLESDLEASAKHAQDEAAQLGSAGHQALEGGRVRWLGRLPADDVRMACESVQAIAGQRSARDGDAGSRQPR